MSRSPLFLGFPRLFRTPLALCLLIAGSRLIAQESKPPAPPQDAPAKTDASPKSSPAPASNDNQEVSTRDTPTTFKVRVNLVLVRVVVRDGKGQVVPNLKKEDFQLYDNRKLQTISS